MHTRTGGKSPFGTWIHGMPKRWSSVSGPGTTIPNYGVQLMETLFEIAGAAGICGGNEGLWGRLVPSQRLCFVASLFILYPVC
jgi:hypothetical protein